MHVIIATLYGGIIWLSLVAYCIIAQGPVGAALVWGPVIISGITAAILTLDLAVSALIRACMRCFAVLKTD